ncbi:MAG TPA: WYL domain-containing protein, partial [Acidimicrobiales bacterium]|nr:WYL domain-containing protein [Acidimicrobiales bacterium]
DDFYLPDLDLAPDEQAALNLAVAGVHLGDPSGRDALWRLGLPASAGVQPFADLAALPALPVLYDAVRRRASVTFDYRGDTRHVAPALLRFRGGWWYLVGFDRDKEASRTFRVDRMEGQPAVGDPGSALVPDDFDPEAALPEEPWRMGEEEVVRVDVLVDPGLAPLVVAEVGESTVHARRDDGSVVVRLEVTNVAALRSWVLELGEHAEVLAPDSVRAGMVSWLEATAGATTTVTD